MERDAIAQLIDLLSLGKLLQAAGILLAVWLLIHAMQLGLKQLARRFPRYRLQFAQGYPALRVLAWSLAVGYITLGIIAPPDSVIFAVLGSIGLAVGLGAQDGIRNLLAGLMMIFNPPFRIGDMVRFGGYYGEVTRIDLSVTWLRTFDDNAVMVPNSELLKNAVANSNNGELAEMVEIPVDLPLGVPVAQARMLAEEAARASPYTFLKKPVVVIVQPRHEYGFLVRLTIKAYVIDVRFERLMSGDIAERFLQALDGAGIMPQRPAPA
ncbi:MAG: mechanosensitive ion channel family protein [Gammaproteobacteria bacterium]|nr:mechanosensitive ion channel family protein [Gammaproteobacteria bacterium]MBU1646032.1 mechanosensitive ion channel family protein [Gammaproteobacteria bacterium]MBU1972094.1 mechanosensitive ion channel family protein [Gammaproteobacteria bacterium]